MDWSELIEHLRAHYRVGQTTRTSVELWQSFREGKRAIRQHQTVQRSETCGTTYYVIEAEVGVPVNARALLIAWTQLEMGTFVERGDTLVVHTQVPAPALTPEALDRFLVVIAREAMRLSMQMWRRQSEPAAAASSAA
jgi:hypothetical protein